MRQFRSCPISQSAIPALLSKPLPDETRSQGDLRADGDGVIFERFGLTELLPQ